jgi:hypothetical protein
MHPSDFSSCSVTPIANVKAHFIVQRLRGNLLSIINCAIITEKRWLISKGDNTVVWSLMENLLH